MARKGREFELLVTRIERVLAGAVAVVKSPDYLTDKESGNRREVDASIRCQVGSVEILITIESRDRAGNEDATWVEQLATKQRACGIARTIAVSSSGFYEPAIAKAKHHGIELRTIEEITDEEIAIWAKKIEVTVSMIMVQSSNLQVNLFGAHPKGATEFTPETQAEWMRLGMEAKIFRSVSDAIPLSPVDLMERRPGAPVLTLQRPEGAEPNDRGAPTELAEIKPALNQIFENLPPDGSIARETVEFHFPPSYLHLELVGGLFEVADIQFDVSANLEKIRVPISRVLNYHGPDSIIVQIAEAELKLDDASIIFTFGKR